MTDLQVSVSTPGVAESVAGVRRLAGSFAEATAGAEKHREAMQALGPAMRRALNDFLALEQAQRKPKPKPQERPGSHEAVSLSQFAPRGSEMLAGRIGHMTGINDALAGMPAAGGMALGAFAGFMALEKSAELFNGALEAAVKAANELTAAHLEATRSAIAGARAQQTTGRGQASSDLDTTKRLAAAGGDGLISMANNMAQTTGDPSARSAVASIYGKFTEAADRQKAISLASQASRLGMGSMESAADALTPYNLSNQDPDQFLREFGGANGRPLSHEELTRRRGNSAGSVMGQQAMGLAGQEAHLANLKRAQIGGAAVAIGAEGGATSVPEAAALSGRFNEFTAKRENLLNELNSQIGASDPFSSPWTYGLGQMKTAGQFYAGQINPEWGTPRQRLEHIDKTWDAGAKDSVATIQAQIAKSNQGLAQVLGTAAAALTQASGMLSATSGAAPAAP